MSPDDLATHLGISRAALYRVEKGEIRKIETLTRVADELGVSLPSLMGVGVEYVSSAITFFERMRQMEASCEQVIGLFSPISYLLTSDAYDNMLDEVLREATPNAKTDETVTALLGILRARKAAFRKRRPLVVSLIASAELERFLIHGPVGRYDLSSETVNHRRWQARAEAEHIIKLLEEQPIGIQIGVVREPVPATSFQIFRQKERSTVAISPFRLGEQPNIRAGVALITSAPEAMTLHEKITADLWENSIKGHDAAELLRTMIDKYAISSSA